MPTRCSGNARACRVTTRPSSVSLGSTSLRSTGTARSTSRHDRWRSSVGRAVLVLEAPPAFDEARDEVVVGIAAFVARRSIADFEVYDLLVAVVHEAVGIAGAGLEPGTHARGERGAALVGVKCRRALQHVHELVLQRMRVAQGRHCTRREARQIDSEIRQAEQVTQRMLMPPRHARGERLGIVRRPGAKRRFGRDDRDRWLGCMFHVQKVYFADACRRSRCPFSPSCVARSARMYSTPTSAFGTGLQIRFTCAECVSRLVLPGAFAGLLSCAIDSTSDERSVSVQKCRYAANPPNCRGNASRPRSSTTASGKKPSE